MNGRSEKSIKEAEGSLDEKVTVQYGDLSVDEIKRLLLMKNGWSGLRLTSQMKWIWFSIKS